MTTIESSVQWMKKTTTYAVKSGEYDSPAAGRLGSANVQIESPTVSAPTATCRRKLGGTNSVAKR